MNTSELADPALEIILNDDIFGIPVLELEVVSEPEFGSSDGESYMDEEDGSEVSLISLSSEDTFNNSWTCSGVTRIWSIASTPEGIMVPKFSELEAGGNSRGNRFSSTVQSLVLSESRSHSVVTNAIKDPIFRKGTLLYLHPVIHRGSNVVVRCFLTAKKSSKLCTIYTCAENPDQFIFTCQPVSLDFEKEVVDPSLDDINDNCTPGGGECAVTDQCSGCESEVTISSWDSSAEENDIPSDHNYHKLCAKNWKMSDSTSDSSNFMETDLDSEPLEVLFPGPPMDMTCPDRAPPQKLALENNKPASKRTRDKMEHFGCNNDLVHVKKRARYDEILSSADQPIHTDSYNLRAVNLRRMYLPRREFSREDSPPVPEIFMHMQSISTCVGTHHHTWKGNQEESIVSFSKRYIKFWMPHVYFKKRQQVQVELQFVEEVSVHFRPPLLLFLILKQQRPLVGIVSRSLGLTADSSKWYSANGSPSENYIFFLMSPLQGKFGFSVTFLRKIFHATPLQELDESHTVEFLHKISCGEFWWVGRERQAENRSPMGSRVARVSPRNKIQSRSHPALVPEKPVAMAPVCPPPKVINADQIIIMWPKGVGSVSLLQRDLCTLQPGNLVNDTVISLWLEFIQLNLMSPEDREKTHFFSSYFYPALTRKPLGNLEGLSAAQKAILRHKQVKNWTKRVDIFSKDFIIVPINDKCHWYLVVICYPGLLGPEWMIDGSPIEGWSNVVTLGSKDEFVPPPGCSRLTVDKPEKILKAVISPVQESQALPWERDEAVEDPAENTLLEEYYLPGPEDFLYSKVDLVNIEGEEETQTVEITSSTDPSDVQDSGISRDYRIRQPCILILNSLPTFPQSRVMNTLREYLAVEYKVRKGTARSFDKYHMPGFEPNVPQQNNMSDCGLFLLEYVERFFSNPISDFHLPLPHSMREWFPNVDQKREDIYNAILELVKVENPSALQLAQESLPYFQPEDSPEVSNNNNNNVPDKTDYLDNNDPKVDQEWVVDAVIY